MIQDLRVEEKRTFEKIVRVRDGCLFRVRFVVIERDGVLLGRVVSVSPITALQKRFKIQNSKFKKEANCLPIGQFRRSLKNRGLKITDSYESHYFNIFDFLTPIKIRAPSSYKI